MATRGRFWEDRLVRPIDVYPEYRRAPMIEGGRQLDEHRLALEQRFVQIETDDGLIGTAGPILAAPAMIVLSQLSHLLVGKDPLATELLWDQMHRWQVHGRQGDAMIALSIVDCALWDLKSRAMNVPLYRLLGGPTRRAIPAYASMLGHAVEDMGLVRERAIEIKERGFTAQKWFFRNGPTSGHEGMRKNVALVRTLRETLGEDHDIMLDCWLSMNLDYAVDLCSRIEEFRPRWIEECFMADRIDSYVKLKAKTRIPLSGGEHEYTRWGFKRFVEKSALDIIQPDLYWCGGLSELIKIAAYATTHDLIVIPHGHKPIGMHFVCSQSPIHTPYQEYLVKWAEVNSHFLKDPLHPIGGTVHLPDDPGAGIELDPEKIESELDLIA